MEPKIKAVTFDARGTLLKVRHPVGETYRAVALRHGADLPRGLIGAAFEEVFPSMPPLAFPPLPERELRRRETEWWRTLVRRVVEVAGDVDNFDSFFDDLYSRYRGAEAWKPYREAASVLCLLRSNRIRAALISNFDSRIEEVLISLNLSIWFNVVVFSSRVGFAKPDPRIFERALAELGVEASEALHVGDNLEKDWRAARSIGMDALLLDRERRFAADEASEVATIADLHGVLDHLEIGGFSSLTIAS